MPSEHNPLVVDQFPLDLPSQSKFCPTCQSNYLVDNSSPLLLAGPDALVCASCRARVPPARDALLDARSFRVHPHSRFSSQEPDGDAFQNIRHTTRSPLYDPEDMVTDSPAPAARSCHNTPISSTTHAKKPASLTIQCNTTVTTISSAPQYPSYAQPSVTTASIPRQQVRVVPYPHPLTDITRLRVRSHGNDCLYPGATFRGIQKSGRNNYDVDVTIVDVNFASSYLCGYLRIRGLTDDHPDLTTYFDAEIIGTRYGFLTHNWGATEQDDLVHWARFPAFHGIQDELKRPHLKLPDRDRNIVFMRWKERFLVPNHRVAEINGASFAGFYYICVDFNPPAPRQSSATRLISQQVPFTSEDDMTFPDGMSKSEAPRRSRRNSTMQNTPTRVPSLATRSSPPVAKMTGFYYHKNSEPYQQLTLFHDPQRIGSSFELR